MCILRTLKLQELLEIINKFADKQRKGAEHNYLMFIDNEAQCFGLVCTVLTHAIIVYLHDTYNVCCFIILLGDNSLHNERRWSNI